MGGSDKKQKNKLCKKIVLSKRNISRQSVVNIETIYRQYLTILLGLYPNYY